MKNKKYIVIILLIFFLLILCFYYKKIKTGNNINKSITDFKQYILNISSYKAKIEVEIISNKNTNKYIINQWYVAPNLFKQEINVPENIQGLVTIYDGNKLEIKNSKLALSKLHEGYNCLVDNSLCLSNFIEESKNVIFFPVSSCISKNSIWISYQNLIKYSKIDCNSSMLYFKNNKSIKLNTKYNLIDNQVIRCIKLDTLLCKRKKFSKSISTILEN